jgi:hypothetical protein
MTLLFLELNEVNFDQVRVYIEQGKLPQFAALIEANGVSETTSEARYEELEPWIQWVSAHTGQTLAQHQVYRLGDIVGRNIDQIWEVAERQGIKVGAISPMNAENRCVDPAFFIPDPWTRTKVSGSSQLRQLYDPIAQAVNDNAESRITASTAANLLIGLLRFAKPGNYAAYVADVLSAVRARPWRKAMILDRLLADVFLREVKFARPGFATLFLNAGAHIQHHYLFNSAAYRGELRNPDWYIKSGVDPVLEVYSLYDEIIGQTRRAFPKARLMLGTGLHQDPHHEATLYWRLRDHGQFLTRHQLEFVRVEPLMSRDFVIYCSSKEQAARTGARLATMVSRDGRPLFSIDNRRDSLFVELIWAGPIEEDFTFLFGNQVVRGLHHEVAFVAVKNGRHNGIGYFVDTGSTAASAETFPITEMPHRICAALGVQWDPLNSRDMQPVAAE